jgi:F0F1-type ATP synthase membrane subunit a
VFGPFGNILGGQLAVLVVSAAPQAALISAVPEPATWTMMIVGFGFVGGTLRMRAKQRFNASVKV